MDWFSLGYDYTMEMENEMFDEEMRLYDSKWALKKPSAKRFWLKTIYKVA